MFKKIMSVILCLSFIQISVFAHPFNDVGGHWAEEEIQYGYENNIINGYDDGLFKPDAAITRAEFVKMLIASFCSNCELDINNYDSGEHWASMYYNFAVDGGIFDVNVDVKYDGVSPALLEGESYNYPIKRWEMAYMLYSFIVNVFGAEPEYAEYADMEDTRAVYGDEINRAVAGCISAGLLQGDENGNFNAADNGTRAQALAIVNRADRATKEIFNEILSVTEEEILVNQKVKIYDAIPEGHPKVKVEMENGDSFLVELYPEYAPQTVANFVSLVKSGFYDGLKFHRVIDGFMAQGGDPKGDGTGGSGNNIIGEFSANGYNKNSLKHERGVLSMARGYFPNSASSQFFICYDKAEYLDGNYAAFGKVIEGMEVVDSFLETERTLGADGEISKPSEDIIMKKLTVIE